LCYVKSVYILTVYITFLYMAIYILKLSMLIYGMCVHIVATAAAKNRAAINDEKLSSASDNDVRHGSWVLQVTSVLITALVLITLLGICVFHSALRGATKPNGRQGTLLYHLSLYHFPLYHLLLLPVIYRHLFTIGTM
jgi:hypothetical protein